MESCRPFAKYLSLYRWVSALRLEDTYLQSCGLLPTSFFASVLPFEHKTDRQRIGSDSSWLGDVVYQCLTRREAFFLVNAGVVLCLWINQDNRAIIARNRRN